MHARFIVHVDTWKTAWMLVPRSIAQAMKLAPEDREEYAQNNRNNDAAGNGKVKLRSLFFDIDIAG